MKYLVIKQDTSIVFDTLKEVETYLECAPRAIEKAIQLGTALQGAYIDILYEGEHE